MGINGIGPASIILIIAIIVILFGRKRVVELAQELGKGLKAFRKAVDEKPNQKNRHKK